MEVKLLGALDYDKVQHVLEETIKDKQEIEKIINEIKLIEISRHSEIVSSAGRLSRAAGNVMEIIGLSESKTLEQNANFAKRVISLGHDSISDHDYCVFAIKDVSPIVEQTIIEERFASFTIKSRRESDFSSAGFYIPNFHDQNGNLLQKNEQIQEEYKQHMKTNFDIYNYLLSQNIPKEDARFILPYCFHSNIIMGMDAHALKDLIIKLIKTKYANINELKEFGDHLYDQAKEYMPYLIPLIDKVDPKKEDAVESFLLPLIKNKDYDLLEEASLLRYTPRIDDTILITSIMHRYQFDYDSAENMYNYLCTTRENFKEELMRKIAFSSDKLELTMTNFTFQTSLSLAVLTHLTRHRTQHILTPGFVPNLNLKIYKTPPTINALMLKNSSSLYDDIFLLNAEMYNHFKDDYGIREEDLVYFALSGNAVNVITNMDGKTLMHILRLRECTKAQWETRNMAHEMHKEIGKIPGASTFEKILGPTCTTQGICNEGNECCGKIYTLKR